MKQISLATLGLLIVATLASVAQPPEAPAQLIMQSGLAPPTGGGNSNSPESTVYTLEIVYPKAIAAAPTGLDSTNAAFFAYPGLTYERPLEAVGGSYDYVWSLSNAPAGMSVTSYTPAAGHGTAYKLVWSNPQTDAADVVITVTDAANATDSETISIDVTTTGWVFLDGANDGTGDTGTAAAPFDTLAQAHASMGANSRMFIRAGTYTFAGIAVTNNADANCEERIEWNQGSRGVAWMAYPGDARPVIDFEWTGSAQADCATATSVPRIRLIGTGVHMSGLRFTRPMVMALQLSRSSRRGVMLWDNEFTAGSFGVGGGNSSFLMWIQLYGSGGVPNTQAYGDVVSSNLFDSDYAGTDAFGATIMYSMLKPAIVGNLCRDFANGTDSSCYTPKADISQYTLRGNTCGPNIGHACMTGNMDSHNTGEETYGEIDYNYCIAGDTCIDIGVAKNSTIGPHHVRRNTLVGPIRVQNLVTADGAYVFAHNAIQNADGAQTPWPYIQDTNITDDTRVALTDNVTGASGVVDASGNLVDTSRLGEIGHVIP